MPVSAENRVIGAAIGKRLHTFMDKMNIKGRGDRVQEFCQKISIKDSTLSTLQQGTKLLTAVNIYYLLLNYPEIDLYWLLTGESRKDDNLLVREEKAVKTAPISIEEQLSKAQEEITFLREQNRQMSQTILNLSARI